MRIVKESLYDFERGVDPKASLGIGTNFAIIKNALAGQITSLKGYTPKQYDGLIKELISLDKISQDYIDDTITDLQNKYGGAFEIYLYPLELKQLFWMYYLNFEFDVEFFEADDYRDDHPIIKISGEFHKTDEIENGVLENFFYKEKIKPLLEKEWVLFRIEQNYSITEYILIKYPK